MAEVRVVTTLTTSYGSDDIDINYVEGGAGRTVEITVNDDNVFYLTPDDVRLFSKIINSYADGFEWPPVYDNTTDQHSAFGED